MRHVMRIGSKLGAHKNSPKVPYAILSKNGSLVIKEPIGYLKLPLREKSALVTLTEKTLMKLKH